MSSRPLGQPAHRISTDERHKRNHMVISAHGMLHRPWWLLVCMTGLFFCACSDEKEAFHEDHEHTRQFKEIRGIVHAHSIYSHDACDNMPEGNTACLMELRDALCTTGQDYLMLTDHASTYADHEFPDVLLYLPEQGDELVMDENNRPYANRMRCANGTVVTLMAGTENSIMSVHLHQHPPGSIADRKALYGRKDHEVIPLLHELGASVIASHPEGWGIDALIELAPDGIEVFNLHAAIAPNLRPHLGVDPFGFIGPLIRFLLDPQLPDPDLVIMTFFPPTTAWTQRWDSLLAVKRCYGVAATDCHRNALPFPLSDGDRGDSYRRMMQFFTNWLLVDADTPRAVERALDTGRGYVVFEFLGMPHGFHMYATDGTTTYELGDEIVGHNPHLAIHVSRPSISSIAPSEPEPAIRIQLVHVDQQGSTIVAQGEEDIEYMDPMPGVYRAEVWIVPYHLRSRLGGQADTLMHEYPWIYSNPIYVR